MKEILEMKQIQIDCANINTKKELFMLIKKQCGFSDYMGNNLDALADVLSEPHDEMEIVFFDKAKCGIDSEWMNLLVKMLISMTNQDDKLHVEFR